MNDLSFRLRSVVFYILFFFLNFIVFFIFLPFIILGKKNINYLGANIWSKFSLIFLRVICNITYEVRGKENIPDENFVVASKHQSIWDTIIFYQVLDRRVAYVYKKELVNIPIFGWFLSRLDGVAIDRTKGLKSLKKVLTLGKGYIKKGYTIIIFPQGTRVKPKEKLPYKKGIISLCSNFKTPVLPVALNSGIYWNNKSILKKPGKIIIEFLPAIYPNLDKKLFITSLENKIEKKTEELLEC